MYRLNNPEKVIDGVKRNFMTQRQVVRDLLNVDVKCEDMERYLLDCYKLIFNNIPHFTSPSLRTGFLREVLKLERECKADWFNLIYTIFTDFTYEVNGQYFQENIMDFPEYLPLLYNEHFTESTTELICETLKQLIETVEMRNELSVRRYSTLMLALSHFAFNRVDECNINWDDSKSSKFFTKLLEYPPEVRKEILNQHIETYSTYRYAQDEYNSVMDAIETLQNLEVDEDGWKPLPVMDLEAFVAEEARINLLHHMNEMRAITDL